MEIHDALTRTSQLTLASFELPESKSALNALPVVRIVCTRAKDDMKKDLNEAQLKKTNGQGLLLDRIIGCVMLY